jgi:hypothetical protein
MQASVLASLLFKGEVDVDAYGPPESPLGALRLQGVRIDELLAPGAACRIGSTPLRRVIAVPVPAVPSVETITTASPL